MKLKFTYKGGQGSGHFGHAGRPGEQGGSVPGQGTVNGTSDDHGGKISVKATERGGKKFYTWEMRGSKYGSYFSGTGNTEEAARKDAAKFNKLLNTEAGRAIVVAAEMMSSRAENISEMKYVQYRAKKNGIVIQDVAGHFGHTSSAIDLNTMKRFGFNSVDELVKVMEANGATKIGRQKRSPSSGMYYD